MPTRRSSRREGQDVDGGTGFHIGRNVRLGTGAGVLLRCYTAVRGSSARRTRGPRSTRHGAPRRRRGARAATVPRSGTVRGPVRVPRVPACSRVFRDPARRTYGPRYADAPARYPGERMRRASAGPGEDPFPAPCFGPVVNAVRHAYVTRFTMRDAVGQDIDGSGLRCKSLVREHTREPRRAAARRSPTSSQRHLCRRPIDPPAGILLLLLFPPWTCRDASPRWLTGF